MLQLHIYFFRAIKDNHKLISRAFQSQFVVPEFGYFCKQIVNLYEKIKSNTGGKVIWAIYHISSKYLLIINHIGRHILVINDNLNYNSGRIIHSSIGPIRSKLLGRIHMHCFWTEIFYRRRQRSIHITGKFFNGFF